MDNGNSDNRANSVQLELELGLRLATYKYRNWEVCVAEVWVGLELGWVVAGCELDGVGMWWWQGW